MKIEDLAVLMGKSRFEVERMLKSSDVIELNLKERKQRSIGDSGRIEILR